MTLAPSSLRPRVRRFPSMVRDVVPLPEGGLAVLVRDGIAIVDETLASTDVVGGAADRGTVLVPLPGGRFLVHEDRMTDLLVGARGGALAKVDLGDALCHAVVPTAAGFVATTIDKVIVDVHGERRWVEVPAGMGRGLVRWGEGAAVAGKSGVTILDAAGEVVATHDVEADILQAPVALASGMVLPGSDEIVVLDRSGEQATIPGGARSSQITPFAGGLLVAGDHEVAHWEVVGEEARLVFRWSRPVALGSPEVAGDRVVVGADGAPVAWVLDRTGALLAEIPLPGAVVSACACDEGVAIRLHQRREVVIRWPGREPALLAHDGAPDLVRGTASGVVSVEDEVLYWWRTDVEGPDLPVLDTGGLPEDTPIVVGGSVVTIRPGGRFALRGELPDGRLWRVQPGVPFRPATTHAEAQAIVDAVLARRFEGDLPRVPFEGTYDAVSAALGQLPPAQTLALHGRALFAPGSLDPKVREYAAHAREDWLGEIGLALGLSVRRLAAALRAGRFPLVPPREIPGWEYLGVFTTKGDLQVGDPCYVGKKQTGFFRLVIDVEALPGTWHVLVRPGVGTGAGRTAELCVAHADGFDVVAAEELGAFGVDSGTAGVFDRALGPRDGDMPFEEGVVKGLGAAAWSGFGDGFYPAFGGTAKGRVAKIRLHFLGPGAPELDTTVAVKSAPARRYSPTERFEVGDIVEHPKFGPGTVFQVRADGKIEVRFADSPRVLVHRRA